MSENERDQALAANSKSRFSLRLWFSAALLALFIFSFWSVDVSSLIERIRFLTFQVRDIQRARDILSGQFIFFGPEMTGGGNLPGGLYYWLLASSFWIRNTWDSSVYLLAGMFGVSAALGAMFWGLRSLKSGLLWLTLFLLSGPLENYLSAFLNVSYGLLFVVGAQICIVLAYSKSPERQRTMALFGACFFTGLAVQFHLSALSILPALLIINFIYARSGVPSFSGIAIGKGLSAFLFPLIPYFLAKIMHASGEIDQAQKLAGNSVDALPSLLMFLDFPSFERINLAKSVFFSSMPLPFWPAAVAWLLSTLNQNQFSLKNLVKSEGLLYLVLTIVGAVPALYIFVAPIGSRYSMVYVVSGIFLTLKAIEQLDSVAKKKSYLILSTILFLALALRLLAMDQISSLWVGNDSRALSVAGLLLLGSFFVERERRLSVSRIYFWFLTIGLILLSNSPNRQVFATVKRLPIPTVLDWRKFGQITCGFHGWPASRALQSLFIVNMHMESDGSIILKEEFKDCDAPPRRFSISGFFMTSAAPDKALGFNAWLRDQSLDDQILAGLESGSIKIFPPRRLDRTILIPYLIEDQPDSYPVFHNHGQGYLDSEYQKLLKKNALYGHAVRLDQNKYLFSWNECADQKNPYCAFGAMVNLQKSDRGSKLKIMLIGDSLGQSSPWIRPEWTQSLTRPFVQYICEHESNKVILMESVGYEEKYGYYSPGYKFFLSNHSVLAPVSRKIELPCLPKKLVIGYEAANVQQVASVRRLEGKSIELRLE